MRNPEIRPLPVAVRVFPYAAEKRKEHHWAGSSTLQRGTLVIHTTESTGSTQKLTFGIYRLIVGGECLEEGLFYADDFLRRELQVLRDYVVCHNVDVAPGGEVLREYEFHLGAKSADAKGKPSGKQTFGLLRRRHVRVERILYIGRESNLLEEIEAGVIHSPETVYTEYPGPSRDEWQTRILPILKNIPVADLMRLSGRSRSMLVKALAGRSRPRRRNQQLLKSILQRLGVL